MASCWLYAKVDNVRHVFYRTNSFPQWIQVNARKRETACSALARMSFEQTGAAVIPLSTFMDVLVTLKRLETNDSGGQDAYVLVNLPVDEEQLTDRLVLEYRMFPSESSWFNFAVAHLRFFSENIRQNVLAGMHDRFGSRPRGSPPSSGDDQEQEEEEEQGAAHARRKKRRGPRRILDSEEEDEETERLEARPRPTGEETAEQQRRLREAEQSRSLPEEKDGGETTEEEQEDEEYQEYEEALERRPGHLEASDVQGERWLNQLEHDGVIVIPTALDIKAVQQELDDTMLRFPEFKIQPPKQVKHSLWVMGGFAALGNPASFHNRRVCSSLPSCCRHE
jgi:hypothetical protein